MFLQERIRGDQLLRVEARKPLLRDSLVYSLLSTAGNHHSFRPEVDN